MIPMGIFAKDSKEQSFWKWFNKNQLRFYNFEKNQDVILDER